MATSVARCGCLFNALYHRAHSIKLRLSFRGQNGTFVLLLTLTALRLDAGVMVAQEFTRHSLRGDRLLELLIRSAGAKDVAVEFPARILFTFRCGLFGYDLRSYCMLDVFLHHFVRGLQTEWRYWFRLWRWCCQMLLECGRLLWL